MESLNNLLKVLLFIYLGIFSYLLYQMLFYHQKRFLFIKTILYFFGLAIIIINVMNKHHIILFTALAFCYLSGIYLGKKFFKEIIIKKNYDFSLLIKPLNKLLLKILKIITIPPLANYMKEKRKLHKYYKLHPNLKPKSPYELF